MNKRCAPTYSLLCNYEEELLHKPIASCVIMKRSSYTSHFASICRSKFAIHDHQITQTWGGGHPSCCCRGGAYLCCCRRSGILCGVIFQNFHSAAVGTVIVYSAAIRAVAVILHRKGRSSV
ncbi:hypothetical protein Y032_0542g3209 [Ancylostoma ceylanicum]|uniref:Uncharacterized protein n=1 Tax=Ancylostoma ceylanicum TaxID=53326 RepID=A0A016WR34_9BILA|nr:hypothetical protein Y032_0542g3209 [Ancylostoma ceylanicum]